MELNIFGGAVIKSKCMCKGVRYQPPLQPLCHSATVAIRNKKREYARILLLDITSKNRWAPGTTLTAMTSESLQKIVSATMCFHVFVAASVANPIQCAHNFISITENSILIIFDRHGTLKIRLSTAVLAPLLPGRNHTHQ